MLTIKKYANGRLYDTENKKYIKQDDLARLLAKKKKVKIVLSKNGKDITKTVPKQLAEKEISKIIDGCPAQKVFLYTGDLCGIYSLAYNAEDA